MKCISYGKSKETSVCDDCSNKKRCEKCNILKTDFYKYKNGKLYSTCIECFNKKVKCEFCNKEFNKTYLSKHIERCLIERCLVEKLHLNNNKIINNNDENIINNYNGNTNNNDENHKSMFTGGQQSCNRTLIVGPSFCGKTHLLLNKLQLIRLDNPEQQIKIMTRSLEQYSNFELEETEGASQAELLQCISVEEDLEDRTVQEFQNFCVVFDDMLDSNQKLIDPFFTRGRHNDLDVYYLSQSYFDLP